MPFFNVTQSSKDSTEESCGDSIYVLTLGSGNGSAVHSWKGAFCCKLWRCAALSARY